MVLKPQAGDWFGGFVLLFLSVSGAVSWVLIIWGVWSLVGAAPRDLPQPYAWAPPARYDHAPRRPTVVREYYQARIGEICGMVTKVRADGCALPNWRGKCIVYMPPRGDMSARRWEALLRHEEGHCNGWPRHHPR